MPFDLGGVCVCVKRSENKFWELIVSFHLVKATSLLLFLPYGILPAGRPRTFHAVVLSMPPISQLSVGTPDGHHHIQPFT